MNRDGQIRNKQQKLKKKNKKKMICELNPPYGVRKGENPSLKKSRPLFGVMADQKT